LRISPKRMAEIINSGRQVRRIGIRHLIYVMVFMFVIPSLQSQDTQTKQTGRKKITLVYADVDDITKDATGNDIHHLKGKVQLKDNDILMWCDSAHYYPDKSQVTAYSKVHIQQGDTLNLYGNYLYYDGKNQTAFVKENVELIDKETHLYTDSIHYDVKNKIAHYNQRGRITNAKNTLTSIIGVYYLTDNLFHFKDSVKIVNPDYVMTADTMDYNTTSKIAYFTGPTELNGDSLYLYCEKGWYDTNKEITSVWKNAMIDNRKQIVHGDSLFFNDSTGYGEAFRNVIIEDTINKIAIEGNYAWYYKEPEKFLATDRAVFIQISSKKDSLFLHADTISAITIADTSSNGYRLMRAYHGCRVFSKDIQSKCDSLSYSFKDSVIRMYTAPVLWSQENQLTADSMAVFTKNQQTDRLELYNAAFIVSQVDTIRFDQIKGRSLTGYFKNNELFKINIKGNGESLYYLLDGEAVAGRNQSKCANMEVLIVKGKVSEIFEYENPEGFIDPPLPADPIRLDGFKWFDSIRPKQRLDIFNK
jgi:lipopolysaccharide export system protein LptA